MRGSRGAGGHEHLTLHAATGDTMEWCECDGTNHDGRDSSEQQHAERDNAAPVQW